MSKKLLISNSITPEIPVEIPKPPTTSGLVCFLDGRNKGKSDVWKDLSGNGNNADYHACKEERGISFIEQSLFMRNDGNKGIIINNPIKNRSRYTIEVAFKFSGEYQATIYSLKELGLTIYDDIFVDLYPADVFSNISKGNFRSKIIMTLSVDGESSRLYCDGGLSFQFTLNKVIESDKIVLGGRILTNANENLEFGKGGLYIYSFKIYDRPLSSNEVDKNHMQEMELERG